MATNTTTTAGPSLAVLQAINQASHCVGMQNALGPLGGQYPGLYQGGLSSFPATNHHFSVDHTTGTVQLAVTIQMPNCTFRLIFVGTDLRIERCNNKNETIILYNGPAEATDHSLLNFLNEATRDAMLRE